MKLSHRRLREASRGDEAAFESVRRRAEYLRKSSRIGLAALAGDCTADQRVAISWLNNWLACQPEHLFARDVDEEAQCRVFEQVYPLVAHFGEVNSGIVYRTTPSPTMLAAALRLNREILGDPMIFGLTTPLGRTMSPYRALGAGEAAAVDDLRCEASVRLLVEAGADIEHRDGAGLTPLLFFARTYPERRAAVKALLRHGADVAAKDSEGGNVLHQLARRPPARANEAHLAVEVNFLKLLEDVLPPVAMRALLLARHGVDGTRPYEVERNVPPNGWHGLPIHHALHEAARRLGAEG